MIFDDLKNITFYKGIHPNLDKAIGFLYEHRKDSFELGKYDIDDDKVFLVVQENTLNKEENNRFEHHKKYADLHLLVEGHELMDRGSKMKLRPLMKLRILALFIVRNLIRFIWAIIILPFSSQVSLTSPMAMQVKRKWFENIYIKS